MKRLTIAAFLAAALPVAMMHESKPKARKPRDPDFTPYEPPSPRALRDQYRTKNKKGKRKW